MSWPDQLDPRRRTGPNVVETNPTAYGESWPLPSRVDVPTELLRAAMGLSAASGVALTTAIASIRNVMVGAAELAVLDAARSWRKTWPTPPPRDAQPEDLALCAAIDLLEQEPLL